MHVDLAVVGGGITGLAAAWEARQLGADVVVLEGSARAGGKLATSTVAGLPVDETADAFLARVPEAKQLCEEAGIGDQLVSPRARSAYIWAHGKLRPLPPQQLLGIPTDLDAVAGSGILSPEGLQRAKEDLTARTPDDAGSAGPRDIAVGELVRQRLGDEVQDLLVGPLIGGIWAGDADRLSAQVAAPAIADAASRSPSLIAGAREIQQAAAQAGTADQPVFLTPRGGMGQLVDALVTQLGDAVRTNHRVEAIEPGQGDRTHTWRIPSAGVTADAVLVTTPTPSAAQLLGKLSHEAGELLGSVRYSSVVLVTLAVAREGIDHPMDGSGFLVPRSSGMLLTACSWASSKWGHLAGDGSVVLLRASAGRDGDERALTLPDDDLLDRLCDDLAATMGLRAKPLEARIGRMHGSFPQPRPGHLAKVDRIDALLRDHVPGVAVAGAWQRGVGLPACIRAGRTAAAALL